MPIPRPHGGADRAGPVTYDPERGNRLWTVMESPTFTTIRSILQPGTGSHEKSVVPGQGRGAAVTGGTDAASRVVREPSTWDSTVPGTAEPSPVQKGTLGVGTRQAVTCWPCVTGKRPPRHRHRGDSQTRAGKPESTSTASTAHRAACTHRHMAQNSPGPTPAAGPRCGWGAPRADTAFSVRQHTLPLGGDKPRVSPQPAEWHPDPPVLVP